MAKELLPVGVRRDGSLYTRIEWASVTESDPTFWVGNLIRDDFERNGGTYGAHIEFEPEPKANVVLGFFGESIKINKVRIYKNVGITISKVEELAKKINIYVSNTDEPRSLRTKDDKIDSVPWTLVKAVDIKKEFGWQEVEFDAPVDAKFVRIELDDNFCEKGENYIPWVETSEIKIYPAE